MFDCLIKLHKNIVYFLHLYFLCLKCMHKDAPTQPPPLTCGHTYTTFPNACRRAPSLSVNQSQIARTFGCKRQSYHVYRVLNTLY